MDGNNKNGITVNTTCTYAKKKKNQTKKKPGT